MQEGRTCHMCRISGNCLSNLQCGGVGVQRQATGVDLDTDIGTLSGLVVHRPIEELVIGLTSIRSGIDERAIRVEGQLAITRTTNQGRCEWGG